MNPVFSPSLHKQRHQFVMDFVTKHKPKKVADMGCGECKLLKQLKFQRNIELLVGVDVNGAKIKKEMYGLAPLSTDYLQPTYEQLHIELYQGSVTQRDARLRGFDLVASIELIEHLPLTDVEHFSSVLFGYMSPASVIVSTPNSEFNKLLPGLTGFRNSDHKFEWNRSEFRSWALKVCWDYGYEVEFTGVGEAPHNQRESVGFCTQIGVFHRVQGSDLCNRLHGSEVEEVFSYTLLYSINYPTLQDNNTLCRVLGNEVLYWAEQMKNRWMEEKAGVSLHCQTERGGVEESQETAEKVDYCGGGEEQEWLWTSNPEQQESSPSNRYVRVPLAVLWACCPKIAELSGSLRNLQHLLTDEPRVQLTQDGSSLLVKCEEQELVDSDLEDSEGPLSAPCFVGAELEEDWEPNV